MSDVIKVLEKNIETLEMLEKEYEKRATPRMKFTSIRSALNNAVISLKKTKDRYSEELVKEPHECNSDLISRKKLIEDIQLIAKELNKDKQNAESDDSDLMLAVDNQLSAIWRIKGVINNQPQVQSIARTQGDRIRNMSDEELAELIDKLEFCKGKVIEECEPKECNDCAGCCSNTLAWLQSEVKEV